MENIPKNGNPVQDRKLPKTPPSLETVKGWVKKDVESAHYLLGLVITRYPAVLDEMADTIYRHCMMTEGGAAIDGVEEIGKELKEELHAD